jgi:hypothetical protein
MPMDCAQFETIVHELERPGTDGFTRRASALAHAENCERCSVLLDKVMSLDFALDSLAVQASDEYAPARVEAALLAEFRRQHAEAARPARNYRLVAALAMAAALLLAVGITAPRWMHLSSPSKAGQNASAQAATSAGNSGESAGAVENAANDDSEYATNFVSLPYADDPGTLDGGTVVRVTLSRAALASFGVPVADMSSTEQIPADIALSEDGVPQAIRLVANADLDHEN